MHNNNAEAEDFDNPRPKNDFVNRFLRTIKGHDDWDEDEDDDMQESAPAPAPAPVQMSRTGGSVSPLRRPMNGLRMDHGRRPHVMVRRAVQSFDDARRSADGLKEGEPQIVNLEQTPSDMVERIVDFLNGATYALDGSVEKIGEQVYLFTPSTITIDVEEKPVPTPSRTSFLDRG